jgi:hypothetical protein
VVRQAGSESGQARVKTRRARKRDWEKAGAEKTLVDLNKQDELANVPRGYWATPGGEWRQTSETDQGVTTGTSP